MVSATTEQIANAPNISRKTPIPVPPQFGGTGSMQPATGTGSVVLSNNPVLVTPNLGTPSSVVLTHGTGLVPSSGLAASGTPSSSTFLRGDNTWASTSSPTTGIWTPAPASGSGVTFSSISAGYTKIGNLVFAYVWMIVNTTADGSDITVSGLPFASSGNNYANAPGIVGSNVAGTHAFLYQCQPGTSQFLVYDAATGAHIPWSSLSSAVLTANVIYSTL